MVIGMGVTGSALPLKSLRPVQQQNEADPSLCSNSKIDRASFETDRIVSFVAVSSSATMADHQPQHLPENLLTGPHDPPKQPPRSHCQGCHSSHCWRLPLAGTVIALTVATPLLVIFSPRAGPRCDHGRLADHGVPCFWRIWSGGG
ncbi:hypothetical protein SAY86_005568 [Trapa natans]|uniref:Uncharacterized protein n=1 Tax=Trapa natans TaxID=22666 RepID=A0AAN7L1M8_TRANT|nr:hypothetical protein SAY86_005568 [Trapa natans]